MDTVIEKQQLEEMLDQAVREVTEKTAGIHLHLEADPPVGDLCTVHITFKKGFHSSLTFHADTAMLTRMTRNIVHKECVSDQDLEDFSKEYFNVLCGKIAGLLYKATKVPARFSVPSFHQGRFKPEDQKEQFALNYADEQRENAQLIHHIPCHRADSTQ